MATSRLTRIIDVTDGLYHSKKWLVTAIFTSMILDIVGLSEAPLGIRLVTVPFVVALWSPYLVHWVLAVFATPGAFKRGLDGK